MLNPELVNLSKLVIVPDAVAAQAYFDWIMPWYANAVVYSCDDAYPKDRALLARAKAAITADPKISVAVCNYDCFKMIQIATQKVFVLDHLLVNDMRQHLAYEVMRLGVSGQLIGAVLEGFFGQQTHIERLNNMTAHYADHVEMPADRLDWRLRLLVGGK